MNKTIAIFLLIVNTIIISAQGIKINRIDGSRVAANSYLIESNKSLFLIDALRSTNDAKLICENIKKYKKTLTIIFITHGHPDHFQGLVELKKNFPKTPIYVANKLIKNDIIKYVNYASKNGFYKNQPELMPKSADYQNGFNYENLIQIYNDSIIQLDKKNKLSIKFVEESMEAYHTTLLESKSLNLLFTSDLVYNDTFLWLGNGVDEKSVKNWINMLENLKATTNSNTKIYPGHGKESGNTLFNKNIDYIRTFIEVVNISKTKKEANTVIKKMYPSYKGDFLLTRSIDNWFKQPKPTITFNNIVDLTHTLNEDFPYIPVPGITFPFKSNAIATIDKMGVAANSWQIHEHLGTQIDAPNHFVKGGMDLVDLNVKDLIVPAVVIDISTKCIDDVNAELTVKDILKWEKNNGKIPDNACVFMYSGWEEHLQSKKFIGLDESGTKHFPGISLEAAEYLVTERKISGVGVDVISFDPGYDHQYKTHKMILNAGKWALECVANLSKIPIKGATVFVGAPKVEGATGGLTRIIAIW